MAKEPVDFIFKADTKQIDKAMSDVANRLEKLGKGVQFKLGGFDAQSLVDSVKSVQDILQKFNEAASNADLSTTIGEVSGLMTAVQKLTDSLDAMEKAAGNVDFSKPFTESLSSIQTFAAELRKVIDALGGIQGSGSSLSLALNVPEEPFKNLTEKIETLTAAVETLETTLGSGASPTPPIPPSD